MKGRIEQAGGQRNADEVVANRPAQVLAHDAQSLTGEGERSGNSGWLRAQKQNIAGFLRKIGAGAHGNAGISLGQRGSVVDAVADHGNAQPRLLKGANASQLAGRIETGFDLGDSSLLRHGRGRCGRIAGEHEHAEAGVAQFSDGFSGAGAKRIARVEVPGDLALEGHPQTCDPGLRWCKIAGKRNGELAEERFIAEQAVAAFNTCGQTAAGKDLHILSRRPREAERARPVDYCVCERVIRTLLGGSGDAQQITLA